MMKRLAALVILMIAISACGEVSIGQPCTFTWPRNQSGAIDCTQYPACAPLLDTSRKPPVLDMSYCPIDCIQMPSLQCENLICVATQIEGDNTHINGQCSADFLSGTECEGKGASFACIGYCSKECLSDASCPKGYTCSHMAPFGENLRCEDESKWGTECSDTCMPAGAPLGGSETCPDSGPNAEYEKCDLREYAGCCTCICYRYCPLLQKKFCRHSTWNQQLFPEATTKAANCS